MSSINGKKVTNEGHRIGPYPIVRNVEEEVEVAVLDDDDKPVMCDDGITPKVKTEIQRVEHRYQIFAEPVWSFDEFNKLFPYPTPPSGGWAPANKGGGKKPDIKDPQFLQDIEEWGQAREGWALMTSLAPSNIKLDDVDMKDPRTWSSIKVKLQASKGGLFSFYEYNAIIDLIDEACGINEDKIAENRESFLAEQQALNTGQTKA